MLRSDEAFVSHALVEFFGGPSAVSVIEGEDPPDFHLMFSDHKVGVEVTQLSQFTIRADGTRDNRATQDIFGTQLIEDLNSTIGPLLPSNFGLFIGLEVPVPNPNKFKKTLKAWVGKVALSPVLGTEHEIQIENSKVTISIVPAQSKSKKVTGFVANKNSNANILDNARLLLEDRIQVKSEKCKTLTKPVWLALFNDYWLADSNTYVLAADQITIEHCFSRIFLVFGNTNVTELNVGKYA
jgi:hypothetical protein